MWFISRSKSSLTHLLQKNIYPPIFHFHFHGGAKNNSSSSLSAWKKFTIKIVAILNIGFGPWQLLNVFFMSVEKYLLL
jgi:hypothetical protein